MSIKILTEENKIILKTKINELDESIDLDYEIGYKRKKIFGKTDILSPKDIII